MPDTTKKSKKKASIICAGVIIGILGIYLAVILYPLLCLTHGELLAVGILVVYGLVICGIIVGILLALRQRLKEIDGGEEEDARKY